jgi:hypothetical protein
LTFVSEISINRLSPEENRNSYGFNEVKKAHIFVDFSAMNALMNSLNFKTNQFGFPFAPRPKYRISDVQEIMRKTQMVGIEPYSKPKIISLCEEGTLDHVVEKGCILIFQDSFWSWVERLNTGSLAKAA